MRLLSIAFALPLLAALLVAAAVSPAAAQSSVWRKIGAWQIHAVPNGVCLALTASAQGSILSVRLHKDTNVVSLMLADTSWRWIEPGARYPLTLQVAPASAEVSGMGATGNDGKLPSLTIANQSRALLDQLGRAPSLRLGHRGQSIATIDLTDAASAIAAMLECQRLDGRQPPPAAQPSPPPRSRKADPFGN